MRTDEGAEMALIWRLVGRETCVACKPIDTRLGRLIGHTWVESRYAQDHFLDVSLKGGSSSLVFWLVSMKPLAVVVLGYLT